MVYVKITHNKDYKNTSKSEILGILTKRFTTTVYVMHWSIKIQSVFSEMKFRC